MSPDEHVQVVMCKQIHHTLEHRMDGMEKAVAQIRDCLANRLPTWATVVLGLMGVLVGVMAKAAFT